MIARRKNTGRIYILSLTNGLADILKGGWNTKTEFIQIKWLQMSYYIEPESSPAHNQRDLCFQKAFDFTCYCLGRTFSSIRHVSVLHHSDISNKTKENYLSHEDGSAGVSCSLRGEAELCLIFC